jgi:cytochrome c biogenesis protein
MSAVEELLKPERVSAVPKAPALNRFIDYVSTVRFGIILLCTLVVFSIVGMVVMQQDVEGFEAYYASLTPAEQILGSRLAIFDIYHSWYYSFLLLILSLNIVLASIDHFPDSWKFISKPKLWGTKDWLLSRTRSKLFHIDDSSPAKIAEAIKRVFDSAGFKAQINQIENIYYPIDAAGNKDFSQIQKENNYYVFGESGKWNRIGAYIVHVALLTLFLGYFVANQTGFNAVLRLAPGQTTDRIEMVTYNLDKKEQFEVQLPFKIDCTDIQQKLINPEGEIDVSNTMDWRTEVKIDDPSYGVNTYEISLNKPLSYRGYRFFQSQAIAMGSARKIKLELTPQNGGDPLTIEVPRDGTTQLPDGTAVSFIQFLPDFTLGPDGKADTKSGEYNNPAAVLSVKPANAPKAQVIAFTPDFAGKAPVAGAAKLGYKWRLVDFEKSPLAHVLSIKYDPYGASFIAWYIGGFGLVAALGFVFFYSHRRIWARIEPSENGGHDIVVAGESNRNQTGFNDRFDRVINSLGSPGA